MQAPEFPERLRELLDASSYSLRQLAKESGVNKDTISSWIRGKRKSYTVATVQRVAIKLGTTAEALLELPTQTDADAALRVEPIHLELISRMARLQSLLDGLPELEALVKEARRLSRG